MPENLKDESEESSLLKGGLATDKTEAKRKKKKSDKTPRGDPDQSEPLSAPLLGGSEEQEEYSIVAVEPRRRKKKSQKSPPPSQQENPSKNPSNESRRHWEPSLPRDKIPERHFNLLIYSIAVFAVLLVSSLEPQTAIEPQMDRASLRFLPFSSTVNNDTKAPTSYNICGVLSYCHKCTYASLGQVKTSGWSLNQDVSTRWSYKLFASAQACPATPPIPSASVSATVEYQFGEGGVYNLTLEEHKPAIWELKIDVDAEPDTAHTPLVVSLVFLMGLAAIYTVSAQIRIALLAYFYPDPEEDVYMSAPTWDEENPEPSDTVPGMRTTALKRTGGKSRLNSLDTFRGMCLAIMLMANDGGGGYWYLDHSAWNGLTVADLVFPWFCFIMGTSMVFAFRSRKFRDLTKRQKITKVSQRGFFLFALGMFDNFPTSGMTQAGTFETWRIGGVLQYLAVSYWCSYQRAI